LVNSDIKEKTLLIAKAYLIEAHSDIEAVDTLIECSKYNLAVYHTQQAVEKKINGWRRLKATKEGRNFFQ